MVTPNFENIAEVNLAGEGFVESKVLAKKFTAMYLVCKELLSKQMHYDWGLRAMSVRGPYPALLLLLLSLSPRTTPSPLLFRTLHLRILLAVLRTLLILLSHPSTSARRCSNARSCRWWSWAATRARR